MNSCPIIVLQDVGFDYTPDASQSRAGGLIQGFSLEVCKGGALGIMGASGSGKSTLAKIISGMYEPQTGTVSRSPDLLHAHDVVYVDQYALNSVFPWLSVEKNLAHPLRRLKRPAEECLERIRSLLDAFKLAHLSHAYPAQLSGGEQQRLALARCLSWMPSVLVLDETFSALDRQTKDELQSSLRNVIRYHQITLVLVTHNVADVLALCSRCIVIGERPMRMLADLELDDPAARDVSAEGFRRAESWLMGLIRNGTI